MLEQPEVAVDGADSGGGQVGAGGPCLRQRGAGIFRGKGHRSPPSQSPNPQPNPPINFVAHIGDGISNWLGQGAKVLRKDAEGFVIQSKDGLREFRIDFSGQGTLPPHAHFEIRPSTGVKFKDAVPEKHRFPFQNK